ncbi:MAG: leucine-rich repeat domain-containing protein, partial [Methanobacteriota archaeon]
MKIYHFKEAVEQPAVVTGLIIEWMESKEFIPKLHEFTALESLEITHTDLADLPEIPLPTLQRLLLSHNRLTSLPVAITKLQHLETLCINEENLEHLPEELCELKRLNFFELNSPKLRDTDSLAKAFAHWPHLKTL